jgi:hypothetical protein
MTPSSPEAPALPAGALGRHLFGACVAALVAAEAYFFATANVRAPEHLQLGMLIVFFAFLPALRWAKSNRGTLPAFEVLMFTTANTYAFPLLNGHEDLQRYTIEDITTAAFAVLLFQIVAICTYGLAPVRAGVSRFWREEILSRDLSRLLSYGIALNTAYVFVSHFTTLVPPALTSILRAVFFGIGIICTFITSRRLGRGELTPAEKTFFALNVFLQCIGMTATLYLVSSVSLLLLALVGYVSGSGRVPVVLCAASLALIAILHHGKSDMRTKYWVEDERRIPALTELPAFFAEWFHHGTDFGEDDDRQKKVASKLIDRTSLFHILCLVVSNTPANLRHLEGETYQDIPAQFVPRFLWPEKPPAHVSTGKLSVYYGLQTEEDTMKTTIGFGTVAEAYANFGFAGIAGIGVFFGFLFKKLHGWTEGRPLFSYGGLVLVILLAWSFQVEFTLSLWLSSFYQACVAVLAIPFGLRLFFR